MDADSEPHLVARGTAAVLYGDRLLHPNRALDRVHRAGEIGHHAVAGGIEYSTVMGMDQSIDDRPVRLKRP